MTATTMTPGFVKPRAGAGEPAKGETAVAMADHSARRVHVEPSAMGGPSTPTNEHPIGPYRVMRYNDLKESRKREDKWILRGIVAAGNVTLLTGQWGWGKTTLISVLLSRLGKGGDLGDQPVAAGRALVVSDENSEIWEERSRVFSLGDHIDWICRPFLAKPTFEDWQALLDQIARMHEQRRIHVLVIDSLANLGPMRSENE